MMGRARPVAKSVIAREGSIAPETTEDAIAVRTGGATAMTEMATGLRSAGEGQGRGHGTVSTIANTRTNIDRGLVLESTEDIDRGVTSVAARKIVTESLGTTSLVARGVRDATRDVATAAGAGAGRPISMKKHVDGMITEGV
jgi:hypothetical protein